MVTPGHELHTLPDAALRARLSEAERDLELLAGQLVETQDQLLAMYELNRATRNHLGLGETLRLLAVESARLVHARVSVLYFPPLLIQGPAELVDEQPLLPFFNLTCSQGRELIINDDDGTLPAGIRNLCVVPIQVHGQCTAALALLDRQGGFSAPDLKLIRSITNQAGTLIEHSLLYQDMIAQTRLQAELAVARKVQLQLLPQSRPSAPTLEIFADSRPALEIGGDFYDFVAEPDRLLTMLIGDVAGKGTSAAMIMGMIHVATRSAARFMPKATPASILGRANDDLYEDLTLLDSFTTAFVAQYDPERRLLHYANAGHAPVIYRPPGGPARLLEAEGVPLGVLPMNTCENSSLEFGPGSLLVVTTDGFNEARDLQGAMFGYERMLQFVDEFADQPPQVIAIGLYDTVDFFSAGQPREDDQTLLIVRGIA